ncbi:decapping endonuclease targeting mRNA, partial [Coemansia biformis]
SYPLFSEPLELVSFSYDKDRKRVMDNRELKYYHPPGLDPPPCLFDGLERQVKRDMTKDEHIDGLLEALTHVLARPGAVAARKLQADFVTFRGTLTRFFITPYSLNDAWSINATRVGSTIYMEEDLTPERIAARESTDERHRRLEYSGYRFETLCVLDAAPESLAPQELAERLGTRADTAVNTNAEYCSVFRTQLGKHSIIAGAEVDCIDRAKPSEFPSRHYRELKTARLLDTARARSNFERFKLLRIWAQSFIAGIPAVTVGFRDDDGILRKTEDFKTLEIPNMVRNKNMWQAAVCMNFANCVLDLIKAHVREEGPETQYRIAYEPESCGVQVYFLGKRTSFLTPEYLAALAAQRSSS